jgi:hypothetical protein
MYIRLIFFESFLTLSLKILIKIREETIKS